MAYNLIEIASNNAQKAPGAMSMAALGRSYNANAVEATETESYNNGGFLGGVGYLGEKLAVGFMSSIEGIWDYAAGGLAKLFGADDWAEQQFANDWFGDWYSHPEEWYNPSDGWRTAGDIAGGIGTSLPSILASIGAVAIAVGTAGAGTPISAGILSAIGGGTAAVTAGLGAAGTSTKQAYLESGQLTGKEFGYGALSGVTEGALEGVTTALSLGTGQIVKSVAGSFAKETAKTVAKQSVVKTLTKGFIGEAFEEGMAEVLDPVWQRLTYNPNAKNATPQEVAYAAFVGGMSGMLMGGAGAVYSSGNSFLKGNSLVGRGLDAEVVGLSQQLAAFETANNTGDETFQNIAQTYADLARSLETTGGKVTTVTQKKLLGDLQRANTVAVFKPMIARSAANIVNNAEVIAERLNAYGYKTADGKPITFTADQLRAGVDVNRPSSFSEALKTNTILRELAIADTTGHLVMDTARFEQATLMGKRLASQVDLNRFIETATPSEISAVSQALGIENWATLDVDTFNQKITSFVENGGVQQYADRRATVQSIQAIPAETARPMPKMVNLRQDGSVRYSDGSTQIAITRQGDAYTVYDYASGHLSKNMTRSEVNKLLRDYNTQQADITAGARAQMEAESELRRQAEELDTYARENITDYSKLSAPNQSMIRKVIREGRAKGISDADVVTYAKISAHAGIDISFDKQATFRGHDAEGKAHYVDGFYDPKTNRIVVNPEAKRSHERLLLHELEHTILNGKDGKKMIATAFKNMDEAMRNKIIDRYSKFYEGKGLDAADRIDIFNDEISAHFAEEILSNRHTLERLVEAEPTLKDKILSFFKGASEDYKSVPKLSRAARSYYKTYKKLFDEFAERNFQNNATEAQTARLSGEVKAQRRALPETDSEGNALSAGQREYFADSKVLDENGNLMVMYHGTPNGAHNTFRSGSYFTPDASYADKYQNPSASSLSTGKTASNPKTYKVYLNITKPFDTRNDAERDIFQNEYYRKYGTGAPLSESGLPDWTDGMDLQEFIEEMGYDYDGLILDEGGTGGYGDEVISRGLSYVTFSSEQVKNVDNKNPTTDRDIRHALPDEDLDALFDDDAGTSNSAQDANFDAEAIVARGMPRTAGKSSLTVGELRKIIANNTKQKVYSKKDALSVVGRFTGISDLTQKTRTEIADAVWQILNESPDVEYRRDAAHDMAEFIVAKIIVDAKTENPDVLEAQERLSYLRTGIGKLSFSEEDISEIRHARDKKGLKQVLGRWGYKGAHKGAGGTVSGKRTPMDVFVVDIAREMPAMEYLEEMHPVDAFLEIDSLYERVLAESKDKWISAYWDMPDSEIPGMIKSVEDEIMHAYETEGEQSKFSSMVENKIGYYSERAEYWKAEYDKIKGRDRLLGLLMSKAQKMKDLKLGTFANSTQHDSEIFKNSIEKLARIQFRGNLNVSGTRKILADLRQWYTSDTVKTGILEYVDGNNTGLYIQGVTDMLETLSEGKGGFTKDDLKMLYDVMSYFTNFVENWGKVFRQGKWIDAKSESERYVNILHANESLKVGLFGKLAGTTYMQTFGDPMTVARRMDRYESGFYTEMMQELRDAAVDAQVAEMEIRAAYDEFTKKHKKYVEKASVDTVTYRDTEIPKMHLIGLYMTMKRKHAWSGLVANGFAFTDTKGKRIRVNGVVSPEAKITNAELEQYAKKQLSAIEALLTDTDKEYIAILEQAFNVDARKLKADRDMQRLGFTNATDDYYYPIRRGNIAKNVDTADIAGELDRVSNSSFNKDTVRGAKQELFIESADAVFNRHIHAVCQYAYLSPAVEAYNRLYNLDISGNKNKPISVATESANTWAKGNTYFVKLISDIQGIPASSGEGMKALGFIRGSYAKFQLGANPKVWLTQLSSIFASSSLLDADSITRGMAVSASGIDKYCSLAKLRNNDNTAAMAQGVLDSKVKRTVGAVSKFSDLLMSPIGKMDRFVVCRIFGACQVQVQKNGGAKIGTEANKVEAGKLLRRVILETQQNAIATERSAAMRSGNEIMRTLTMFTSDSMKVVGRVIDAVGEVSTLKSKLKATTDADARTALKQQLNAANRKARKAVGALCLTAVFMASIAQLFRWLYDKEPDDDESVAETMLVDAVGNLFGGLPLFKDAYAKIFEGYDVDNYAYSALNDLLDSALNLFGVAGNILTNEGSTQERNRAMRDLAYSVGQLFGIPVRNIYNVFFGLTKRFNPETAYVIDNAFYEKNYQNELYKAIEEDDAEMTSFIMSLLLGERMNENVDEAVFNELLILSKNGQKVIPRSVPSSITIDEVEYPLSAAEQAAIKDIYATSEKSLKALFAKSKYNTLSDEQKAAAIDFIYDTYYDKALEGALGIDRGNNNLVIADVVGVDNLALLYVTTKGLTSDMDRRGNVISGSKRKKVVAAINSLGVGTEKKLLLICAKGYSLQDNDIRGLSAAKAKKYLLRYILSLKGKTKAEKAEIAELCGFEVKNGGVVTKSVFSLG